MDESKKILTMSEVLDGLDRLLERNSSAPEDRTIIIKGLKSCAQHLGVSGLQSWVVRIAHSWDMSASDITTLLEDLAKNVHLLIPATKAVRSKDKIYPSSGWIADYLYYTLNSEAPTAFHFWTAVSVVGAVLSRNVYFDKAHYKVYPNHFIILVAPSGTCRKTSALNIGVKLLRKNTDVNIMAEKVTPEALVETLTNSRKRGDEFECSGFIHAPELAVFLGKQLYNEGLIALLTGLSDNPDQWEYKTRNKAEVKLTNVSLSLIGASTRDWLEDCIPQSAFGGGFMSRILFIVQQTTDRCIPFPTPNDLTLEDALATTLTEFNSRKGICTNSQVGRTWFEKWYKSLSKSRKRMDDPRISGYLERKPDHLIRLAIVLAVCRGDDFVLTDYNYEEALAIIDGLESLMPDAFAEPGESASGGNARRVIQQLRKAGVEGIQHSKLLKKNHRYMDAQGLKRCVDTLKEAKIVDKTTTAGKIYYYLVKGA